MRARRRLRAVMLAGVTGYGVTLLFVLHAGPDLALTQALAETITLVVFVLALRRLPPFFSSRPLVGTRWVRVAIGVAVGTCTSLFALVASGARVAVPVSIDLPDLAYSFGGGKNVVNVTLVDARAWDTMGEISVLLVAATGVASLVFNRRMGSIDQAFTAHTDPQEDAPRRSRLQNWLPAGSTVDPERRSVVFEVVTRLTFHAILVLSLYLVFSGTTSPAADSPAVWSPGSRSSCATSPAVGTSSTPRSPSTRAGCSAAGLFLSAGTGLVGILIGQGVLQTAIIQFDVVLLGHVKLVTSLFFDVGVYLLVVGLVVDVIRSLGAEVDRQIEEEVSR